MQLHRYPRCKIPGASQDDCCPFRTPLAVSALHHISCHRSQMSLDTRSRPSALVHLYMFVFTGTCLFSLICVCSHLYRFIYSCTCMLVLFSVVRARSNCSQLYALVFSYMHSFSVVCTCFQLDIHFQFYALVFSWMHSFSVGCTHSLWYVLKLKLKLNLDLEHDSWPTQNSNLEYEHNRWLDKTAGALVLVLLCSLPHTHSLLHPVSRTPSHVTSLGPVSHTLSFSMHLFSVG